MLLFAIALATVARSQSHLEYAVVDSGEEIQYYTTNVRIRGLATTFRLCLEPTCVTTLSQNEFPDVKDAAVVEDLITPEARYIGLFVMAKQNVLSLWDFERASMCKGKIFTSHVPLHCRFGARAIGVCSGSDRQCRFRARVNNKPAVGSFTGAMNILCTEATFEVETNQGYQSMCAEKQDDGSYLFTSTLSERTAAIGTVPHSPELYLFVDLRVHDDVEVGLFTLAITLALIVWIQATNGGLPIKDTLTVLPTDFQRLIIADVSFSVATTGVFQIVAHQESLVPAPCSHQFGEAYAWASTILFVALTMVCNAIVVNCVRVALTPKSVTRAILLRHAMEVQLMLSLFFYFPASFGWELRELMGLFVGSTVLVILGRDTLRLFRSLDTNMSALVGGLFLLEFQHCALVCIFPALYRTPGILNDAAAPSAFALASSMVFMGTKL